MSHTHQLRLHGAPPSPGANKRQGNTTESAALAALARAGIYAHRLPEPLRIVGVDPRNPAQRVCRLESDLAVDVMGYLPDGTSLSMEVKSVEVSSRDSGLRWSVDERLRGHQGEILARAGRSGCAAFVYLQRLGGWYPGTQDDPTTRSLPSALYLLPWPDAALQEGRASWRWEELERWRVPPSVDWTRALVSREVWAAYRTHGWTP